MRSLALKLVVPAILMCLVAPAQAGPKEDKLLAAYAGTWRGASTVSGPMQGPVECVLKFNPDAGGKLRYAGDCTFDKGKTAFRGTIIYNDGARRYETAGSGQGVSVTGFGKNAGGAITFSVANVDTSYGVASSTMVLAGSSIKLSFKLVDKKGTTSANITFRKG